VNDPQGNPGGTSASAFDPSPWRFTPSGGYYPSSIPPGFEVSAEALACAFHEAYERLAPSFGYATREASAVPWAQLPQANRLLMIAVAEEILTGFAIGR